MKILMALFPLMTFIGLGYLMKRRDFLSDEFWRGAEKLNYFVLFPAMLFQNLAFIQLNWQDLWPVLQVAGIGIAVIGVLMWLLKYLFQIPAARFGVYVQSHLRFNTYMGLSLVGALLGQAGMQIFAVLMAIAIPVVNILSVLALSSQQQQNWSETCVSLLKNPLILGCLVGLMFNLSGLSLWQGAQDAIRLMAAVSLPLGLLCIGAALQFSALGSAWRALLINSVGRLLVVPVFAYLLAVLMSLTALQTMVLVVFFALPTASASYILTRYLHGDYQLMAGVISLQTLLFGLSFPLMMWSLSL